MHKIKHVTFEILNKPRYENTNESISSLFSFLKSRTLILFYVLNYLLQVFKEIYKNFKLQLSHILLNRTKMIFIKCSGNILRSVQYIIFSFQYFPFLAKNMHFIHFQRDKILTIIDL